MIVILGLKRICSFRTGHEIFTKIQLHSGIDKVITLTACDLNRQIVSIVIKTIGEPMFLDVMINPKDLLQALKGRKGLIEIEDCGTHLSFSTPNQFPSSIPYTVEFPESTEPFELDN